VFYTSKMK